MSPGARMTLPDIDELMIIDKWGAGWPTIYSLGNIRYGKGAEHTLHFLT